MGLAAFLAWLATCCSASCLPPVSGVSCALFLGFVCGLAWVLCCFVGWNGHAIILRPQQQLLGIKMHNPRDGKKQARLDK